MNRARRKRLQAIAEQLEGLKAELEEISGEEDAFYDAMPDGIRDGAKGDRAQEVVSSVDEAAGYVDDVLSSIEEAVQ